MLNLTCSTVPFFADTDLKLTNYQKKARESRMKIYEDTITRFYNMIDLYTPFKMRPRLWDEQKIPTEYWNSKIKQPIRMLHLLYMCSMAVALYDPMLR